MKRGLDSMVEHPASRAAAVDVYTGGWFAIRVLNSGGCYPAVGHLLANLYSARYSVHQGACSGVLCARLLAYHRDASAGAQARIADVLAGGEGADAHASAARLVADLVARLPGVAGEHADTGVVDVASLRDFAAGLPLQRLNALSLRPFATAADLYAMMTLPLDEII